MAKVYKNLIIQGLSGDLGKQLRIQTSKTTGQTYVFAKTNFETRRKDSPAQRAQKLAFSEASAYADAHQTDPIYIAKAKGRKGKERQPYNVAMADWFHPPAILRIDLGGWRGAAGELIRILAVDDVRVAQVRVEIQDGAGALVEAGEAILKITQWWEYAVRGTVRGEGTVTVFAKDLPGHVTQASESKRLPG